MKNIEFPLIQPNRRDVVRALAASMLAAGTPLVRAQSSDYPAARPITLIVPWTAGGGSDAVMRAFAQIATKYLKQQIIIENKPGVGGTMGPAYMARTAKPDGYTLSQIPGGIFRQPAMRKVDWNPSKDFSYISRIGGYQVALVVRSDSPFKTLPDLVAFAKANPGQVTYGSTGIATSNHLGVAAVALKAGVELTHIPYKGSSESLTALLGGHVMFASSESAGNYIDTGKLRALATCGEKRLSRWPDVPTLIELGYNVTSDSAYGLAGPAGMDPKTVAYLDGVAKQVMNDPEFLKAMAQFDMTPLYLNTADYKAFTLREETESKQLIEALGLVEK